MQRWLGGVREANGIGVHYLRTGGAGRSVVMLHGLIGSGACWTPVVRALDGDFDGDFDVVMPDARGHGGSSAPPRGYRYDDLASDVEALVRELALARPVLVGHSMGGMTAALVASRGAAALRGLVLVDPTFLSPARQREVYASGVADEHRAALRLSTSELVAQARARHPGRSPEIMELQAEARSRTRIEAFEVLAPPNPDYHEVVRAIRVPTLLVVGDHDPVVTPEMAAEMTRLNPRIGVELVRDAGHGLPFQQPARLGAVIGAFVRGLV